MTIYSRKVDLALDVAMSFLGKPYTWAGDDPVAGFDCSGLMIEILQSVGIIPDKLDMTAAGLLDYFRGKITQISDTGCLYFWNFSGGNSPTHVEMVVAKIGNNIYTIGAMSGGSKTRTLQDAIDQNAYVKIRPAKPNQLAIVNPFWDT